MHANKIRNLFRCDTDMETQLRIYFVDIHFQLIGFFSVKNKQWRLVDLCINRRHLPFLAVIIQLCVVYEHECQRVHRNAAIVKSGAAASIFSTQLAAVLCFVCTFH